MIYNEFNPYRNCTYTKLNGGWWCYEKQRFIRQRTPGEMNNAIDGLSGKSEFSRIDAAIDLYLHWPAPWEN